MITQEEIDLMLSRLTGQLKELLDSELALGNEIVEVAGSWPCVHANIWLRYRFMKDYSQFSLLRYRYLGDQKTGLKSTLTKSLVQW